MADLGTIGISIEVRGRDALRQIEGDMNSIDRSTKNAARSFEVFERAGLKTAETFRYMSEQSKKRLVDEQRITQEIVKQRAAVEQLALANAQKSQVQIGRNLGLGAKGISAGASADAITAEVERLRLKYDQIYSSSQLYERSLKEINQAHMLGVLSVKQHEAALESLNVEYQNFQNGVAQAGNRFAQHSAQTASGMSKFGVVTQQAGYQIGDFLVQIQSGTNWMVAFGQQATQLVGVLPLMGAGFLGLSSGALVALSAGLGIAIPLITAIGAYFMRTGDSAEKAKDQVNDLDSAIKNIDASLKEWTQTKQAAAQGMTVEQMFGGQSLAQAKTDLGVALRIAQQIQEEARNTTGLDAALLNSIESLWGGGIINRLNAATAEVEKAKQRIIDINAKLVEEQKQNSDDSRVALQNEFDMQMSIAKFGEDSAQTKALANKQALDDYNRQIDAQVRVNELTEEQGSKLKAANLLNTYLLDITQKLAAVAAQELIVTKNQREADDARAQERLANEKAYQAAVAKGLANNQYWSDQAKAAERQAAAVDYIVKNLNLLAAKKDAEGFNKAFQEALDAGVKFSVVDLSTIVSLAAKNGWNLVESLKAAWAAASQSSPAAASVLMGGGRPEVNLSDTKYRQSIIEARAAIVAFEKEQKKLTGTTKELKKELTATEKTAKEFADTMDGYVVSAVGSVSDAFGAFVMRGFKDFKGFVNSILGSFTNMLAQMISLAARNQIMISMGMSGAGMVAGGAANAAAGAVGGGLGGIATGIGMAGGAIASGLMSGAGLVINAGMTGLVGGVTGGLAAFTNGISAIGTVAGAGATALGGLATAVGAIALPVLAVVAVFSFFKKKTKELDRGLLITVKNMDTLVETFKKTETKQFWGLSRKVRSSTEDASAEIADPIEVAVAAIQNSIVDMSSALNIGSETFDDFAFQLKISLKRLSAEEATAKVQEELMKVGDAMAEMIPELVALSQGSETASETLVRLYTSLQVANAYFGPLVNTLFEASLAGADLASTMIQAFGSVDAFNTSMSFFAQNFYTEAEQVAWASERVSAAFKALGLAAPTTAEAFRNLVESLMVATTSGVAGAAEQLAAILAVQQDMFTVNAYNVAQAEAAAQAQAAIDAQAERDEKQRQDELNRLQKERDAAADREKDRLQEERDAAIKKAQDDAAEAAEAAAQRAKDIAQERYGLETQLLELQGNTVELRNRELALLDPTNRALQEMVWKLGDAKDALEAINEVDFATKVDYLRATGLARNSISGFASGGMHSGGARIVGENGPELEVTGPSRIYSKQDTSNMFRDPDLASAVEGLRNEVSGMRSEQLQLQVEISKNTKRVYDVERKWDIDGLPPVRV